MNISALVHAVWLHSGRQLTLYTLVLDPHPIASSKPQSEVTEAPVVRSLFISFAESLSAAELPAFRGAIGKAVGPEAVLFHQHEPDGRLRYQYPLIQYRLYDGRPALFWLHDGVEAAQLFLQRPDWELNLGGQPVAFTLADMRVRQHYLRILPEHELALCYRVRQWLPFNQENYEHWQQESSLAARYGLLEKLLVGHMLAFAAGVDWFVPTPIKVALTHVRPVRGGWVKGQSRVAFDVEFRTNVVLPEAIGLGRNVSLGYGVVQTLRSPAPRRPRRGPASTADTFDPTAE